MKRFHGFGRGGHLPWAGTVLLLLLTLLAGRGFAAAPKQEARRIAIVIGAGQFPGAKGTLSPLRWSAYDAVRVASVFLDPRLGAFNKVYLLVSARSLQAVALDTTPLGDEPLLQSEFGGTADAAQALLEAPTDQVERREPTTGALKTLLKELQGNMREDELLTLYVAGHGAIEGESYAGTYLPHERMRLILEDAEVDSNQKGGRSFRNTLSLAELLMALSKVPARRKVLIQDVCHSGLAGYTFRGTPNKSTQGWQSRAYRTTVLTSSGPAESSIELDSLKGGLFTHALIRVLQAPINDNLAYKDSEVTVEDVWEATRILVPVPAGPLRLDSDTRFL